MIKTLTIAFLVVFPGMVDLFSQESSITDFLAECERKYGKDADLVNGEKYFYPYAQALGDPFLFPEARRASITIHGKEFVGQKLRYDLYNQELILDFKDIYGATSSLVLRNEWVEAFAFDGYSFKIMGGPDAKPTIFQVLTEGPIACVYKWSKKYLLNLNSGVQSYYFTDPVKVAYLVIEGKFYPYKGNRNFLKAFHPDLQKPIKQFMRQGKIKVKRASDAQMRHLVEYCNSLFHEN